MYKFNVVKEERKALVKAISEITGYDPIYKGAPVFEYVLGDYKVSVNGTVTVCGIYDEEELARMLVELVGRGFAYVEDGDQESADESLVNCESHEAGSDIGINIPIQGFSTKALSNLQQMVKAKAWIIKLMTGADDLPIENIDGYLHFPWFKKDSSAKEVSAYSHLITRLCATAKEKRRITAEERLPGPGDNVKYKGRCFLLSIGFIGSEYSQARKVLLANLPGSGSFLQGNRKKEPVSSPTPPSLTIPNDDMQNIVDVQNIQEAIV